MVNIIKAGFLAGPAFLLAGCVGASPVSVQHELWFVGRHEFFLPLSVILIGLLTFVICKFFPIFGRSILRVFRRPIILPALWVFSAALFIVAKGATKALMSVPAIALRLQDSYFLGSSSLELVSFIVSFLIAAIVFALWPKILSMGYNVWLAWICWLFYTLGAALIVFPRLWPANKSTPNRYVEYNNSYGFWDYIYGAGIVLCGIALATFVILVIEALVVRRPLRDKAADTVLDNVK